MNMDKRGTPKCESDLWVLNFLRCYSDAIVTSGENLRAETDPFLPSQPAEVGLDPDIYFKKPKPVAILTNKPHTIVKRPLFGHDAYKKIILTGVVDAENIGHNDVVVKEIKNLNLRLAIDYL